MRHLLKHGADMYIFPEIPPAVAPPIPLLLPLPEEKKPPGKRMEGITLTKVVKLKNSTDCENVISYSSCSLLWSRGRTDFKMLFLLYIWFEILKIIGLTQTLCLVLTYCKGIT